MRWQRRIPALAGPVALVATIVIGEVFGWVGGWIAIIGWVFVVAVGLMVLVRYRLWPWP